MLKAVDKKVFNHNAAKKRDQKISMILLAYALVLIGLLTACQPASPQDDSLNPGISVSITGDNCPNIEVQSGQYVTWTNEDTEAHVVRETPADGLPQFDSDILQPGDSYQISFVEPGTFNYVCSEDAATFATIVVTP